MELRIKLEKGLQYKFLNTKRVEIGFEELHILNPAIAPFSLL